MDTRNAESHGTTGGAYEESSVGADASASTSETHTGTSESPLSAVEAATALSLCATLHLQVVHAQARFVAEEVQKLQYDAATPEAIIASPSIDVTLQGPGGRAASDAEATVMSLMDSSGLLSSPSSLQEAMILMTKLKNPSHKSHFLYVLGQQTTTERQRQFVLNGGLRLLRLWLEEGVRETQIPLLKDIATVFRKLPFDVDAFMKSHIAVSFKELKSLKDETLDRHVKEIKKFVQEQGGAARASGASATVSESESTGHARLDGIPYFTETKEALEKFQSQFVTDLLPNRDSTALHTAAKPKVPLKVDIVRNDSVSADIVPPPSASPSNSSGHSPSGPLLSFASFSSHADAPAVSESPSGDVGSPTQSSTGMEDAKQNKGTKVRRKAYTFATDSLASAGPVLRGVLKVSSSAPPQPADASTDPAAKPLLKVIDAGKARAPSAKKKKIIWVDEIRSGMSLCSVKHFDPDGMMNKSSKKVDTSAEMRKDIERRRLDFMNSMPTMNKMFKFRPLVSWNLSKIVKPPPELVLESKPVVTCKDQQSVRQQAVQEVVYPSDESIPTDPATFQDLDGKSVHTSHTYAAYYDNDGELVNKAAIAEGHVPDRMRYNLGETFVIPARIPWRGENEQPGPNEPAESVYISSAESSSYEFNLDRMDGVYEPAQRVSSEVAEEPEDAEEQFDPSSLNLPDCLLQCDPLLLLFLAQDIENFMVITVDQKGEAIDERKAKLLSEAVEKFKKGGRPCTPSDIARIFSETVGDKAPPLPPLEVEAPKLEVSPVVPATPSLAKVFDLPAAPAPVSHPTWQQSHYSQDPYGGVYHQQRPMERVQLIPASNPYGYPGSVGSMAPPVKSRGQPNVGITRKVCRFFTSPEGCRFGEKCMNIHPGGKRKFDDMYS